MAQHRITSLETRDVRFPLEQAAGSDAVHSGAEYAFCHRLARLRQIALWHRYRAYAGPGEPVGSALRLLKIPVRDADNFEPSLLVGREMRIVDNPPAPTMPIPRSKCCGSFGLLRGSPLLPTWSAHG